jgi:hypothetical protein
MTNSNFYVETDKDFQVKSMDDDWFNWLEENSVFLSI